MDADGIHGIFEQKERKRNIYDFQVLTEFLESSRKKSGSSSVNKFHLWQNK